MHWSKVIVCTFASFVVIWNLSCSRSSSLPWVDVVVGEASLSRSGKQSPLRQLHVLRPGDTVRVAEGSKVKLLIDTVSAVYLNSGSSLSLDSVPASGAAGGSPMCYSLLGGTIHAVAGSPGMRLRFAASGASFTLESAHAAIGHDPASGKSTVFALLGIVKVDGSGGRAADIPACTRYEVGADVPGQLLPFDQNEIAKLKEWVGPTTIETPLAAVGCLVRLPPAENLAPEWMRMPQEACELGTGLADSVYALDPEGKPVAYTLENGPRGMTLGSATGAISFRPSQAGVFAVTITASDPDMNRARYDYKLTVTAGLSAVLLVPRLVTPSQRFTVSLSPARKPGAQTKGLTYRFDLDGDGEFETPRGGTFGPQAEIKEHALIQEGVFTLRGEIRDKQGNTARSERQVIVNSPPKAVVSVQPAVAPPLVPVLLDARKSLDSSDSLAVLTVRWDLNGDGAWDVPENGGFSTEKTLSYAWSDPATYTVRLEVRDSHGATDTATVQVIVARGVASGAIKGPDSAHVGDTVRFECTAVDSQFPIVSYAWAFGPDSASRRTTTTGKATHVFRKAGSWQVQCAATNEKGQSALQQKIVTIVNTAATVDAGGPYRARVNSAITVDGKAKDPDSRIVRYAWDFDNDGTPEWSSPSTAKTSFTPTGAGRKVITFIVTTSDSAHATDTAVVEVSNTGPLASAGEDVVGYRGQKVKLSGSGSDTDGKIVKYEWDFEADGTWDWSSEKSGVVRHEFKEYGNAVLRVTDSEGSTATDTVRVVVCPAGMATIESGKFCIDKYEWPNKSGSIPAVNSSYEEAADACRGAGKRLCTADEWERACRHGKDSLAYPYGRKYDLERCNTLGNPFVKNKLSASASFPNCRGPAHIFDMSGNAAEWVESPGTKEAWVYGGSWQNGDDGSGCTSRISLARGRKYFYAGFRCCK